MEPQVSFHRTVQTMEGLFLVRFESEINVKFPMFVLRGARKSELEELDLTTVGLILFV